MSEKPQTPLTEEEKLRDAIRHEIVYGNFRFGGYVDDIVNDILSLPTIKDLIALQTQLAQAQALHDRMCAVASNLQEQLAAKDAVIAELRLSGEQLINCQYAQGCSCNECRAAWSAWQAAKAKGGGKP